MQVRSATAPDPVSDRRLAEVDEIVKQAGIAAKAFRRLNQEETDCIVTAMVVAALEAAEELAELAVKETGFGVFEDKVVKNYAATEFLYDYLKDKRSVGVIERDSARNIDYVADPIGVVLAITPITNPTSTVIFKAIVAAKTRNAVIFRPSPGAVRCAERTIEILCRAATKSGMPPGALHIIPDRETELTHHLFKHPGVDFIWATGGPKIVQAASSAGKPVLCVGPGNAPIYVHRSADVSTAVVEILMSKTFDNSVICPAEQTCVIDDAVYDETVAEFERMGARLLNPAEVDTLAVFAFGCGSPVNMAALGQPVAVLARRAGIDACSSDKVLLAPLPSSLGELAGHPLIKEKLMPVLGLVRATDEQHAIDVCELVTEHGGLGHTSAIYARDQKVIERYAASIRTGRILVNAPTTLGALGGIYNSLTPTFSLGCGTWGGSNTTDNINYRNLLNIKTVARRCVPPQWFRVPPETYFNAGAIDNLNQIAARQVVIVTDANNEQRGAAEMVRQRLGEAAVHVFSNVQPEPDESTIRAGVEVLQRVHPNLIVALGGGSVLDAAKAMRLFYEHPELTLHELALPFLDPRKRVAKYPQGEHKVKLIAMPTTSGTGSEVSPASVITSGTRKLTLVDYTLVPDMAIVDPMLTLSMPPSVTADSGMDALTHAIEAAVSIFASPYSDAFCVQSARLAFEALPRAYEDGADLEARTAMANAATLAGLAFSNAFVGVNHALAHAVGARFKLPHGRANAIFLPHVIRYNLSLPTKFMPAPGYTAYVAPAKYAQLGRVLFGGRTDEERCERLLARLDELLAVLQMPRSLRDAGVTEDSFLEALPELARSTFSDPSIRTNPRMPLIEEIMDLLRAGFYGTCAAITGRSHAWSSTT
jgi:acetaldehyde dehydrogenase / alcohol dehydrogenase